MATSSDPVLDIEEAIAKLNAEELAELYAWLDQNHPQPIDVRLGFDLAAGRLDAALFQALEEEKSNHTRPL